MSNRLLSLEKKLVDAGLGGKRSAVKSIGQNWLPLPSFNVPFIEKLGRLDFVKPTDGAGPGSHNKWISKGVETAKAKTFKEKLIERKKAAYNASKSKLDLFKANIYAIIDTLDVENTPLYQPTNTSTYCNLYCYDVVSGLGGYLPRFWWATEALEKKMISGELTPETIFDKKKNKAYNETYGAGVTREQTANLYNDDWFDRIGVPYFGWEKTSDMDAAQAAANAGYIVVLNAQRSGHGHMTIVLPELPDSPAKVPGVPLQSQAGSSNHKIFRGGKWWKSGGHSNGHAWIFKGEIKSPLFASAAELGGAYT